MPRIYIVRHAEAEGNLFRRAHGIYDGKITPNGKLQIEQLEMRIKIELERGHTIDAIYSSDLTRTMDTAGAVSRATGLQVTPHQGLREVGLGVWEDMPWALCSRLYPNHTKQFMSNPDWRVEGSESPTDVYNRTSKAFNEILSINAGKSVCFVSHSVAIRAILCNIYNRPVSDFAEMPSVDNASLTIFDYDGSTFTPVTINDSAHNAGLPLLKGDIPDGGPWPKLPNLWFRSAELKSDTPLILNFWRDSWIAVHHNLSAFHADSVVHDTKRILRANKDAISFAMFGDKPVGILVMDSTDLSDEDSGHISLFAMSPEFRGRRFAVQLLGQAISFYRSLGRTKLKLRVFPQNSSAIKFYEKNEFKNYGYDIGHNANLFMMKRHI